MDDVISRQQAIDALDKRFDNIPIEQTTEILQLRRDLRQLPSAEPKMGRWITDKQGFITWSAICNKCRARTQMFDGYYNFCPNCGADMREVTT